MDELEQALRARWDRDTLLVYADALQARGDPRGELIALDVEIAERGITPELARRRRRRLYEWLGGSTIHGRAVHEGSFRYGFVTDFYAARDRRADGAAYLATLLASPAGAFVRGLTIGAGDAEDVRDMFAELVRAPRPWLERLEVRVIEGEGHVSGKLVDALIAATPRLGVLAVHGVPALAAFPHPAVRRLVIDAGCLPLAHTIPHADTVELVLDDSDDAAIASSVHALAALRHLDLARNEPHYPPADPPNVDVYPLVRWLASDRLASLRLPSLRTPAQIAQLGEVIDLHPALEVTIARSYTTLADLLATVGHPRLHLPEPLPWPPPDTVSSREALTITVPTEEYGDDLSLVILVDLLEAQWDELPPNARDAWRAFWRFLRDLPWDDADGQPVTRSYPAAALLTALEPLDAVDPPSGVPGTWAQLAEKLRAAELPEDGRITVRRYWGW